MANEKLTDERLTLLADMAGGSWCAPLTDGEAQSMAQELVRRRGMGPEVDGLMCASCDMALMRPDDPGVNYAFCKKCVESSKRATNEAEAGAHRYSECLAFVKARGFDTVADYFQMHVASEFWRGVFTDDVKGDTAQIEKELSDFHRLIEHLPKLYMHITGGGMSKINYDIDTVISVANEHMEKRIDQGVRDILAVIRDNVLEQRGPVEGEGLTNDQINAVLTVIDDETPEEPE